MRSAHSTAAPPRGDRARVAGSLVLASLLVLILAGAATAVVLATGMHEPGDGDDMQAVLDDRNRRLQAEAEADAAERAEREAYEEKHGRERRGLELAESILDDPALGSDGRARVLREITGLGEHAFPGMVLLMREGSRAMRLQALDHAAALPRVQASAAFWRAALGHDDTDTVLAALRQVARTQMAGAGELVTELTRSDDREVRYEALRTLVLLGRPESTPVLTVHAESDDVMTRRLAMTGLRSVVERWMDDGLPPAVAPTAGPAAARHVGDPDPETAAAARALMRTLTGQDFGDDAEAWRARARALWGPVPEADDGEAEDGR